MITHAAVRVIALAGALLAAAVQSIASAQEPPRAHVGAGIGRALIVGDASDFLDGGSTRFLFADFRMDARERLHVRVDGSLAPLEDDEDQFTNARAENDLLLLVGGPQVGVALGPVRPYIGAVAGLASVRWSTDRPGSGEDEDGTEGTFAWGGHGGIAFRLGAGDHPVLLRIEARILDLGTLPFARAPDPAGPAPTGLIREDIAVLGLRAGISLGF